jgi:hypothetical protein
MFFSFSLVFVFFKVLKRASPFDRQRKMNQKEKSQLGSVAMNFQWLGRDSSCRNITNAAFGPDIYEEVI